MWRYIVKRLLWMVFVFVGVAFLIFTIMFFCPGDPAELILGSEATTEELEAYREKLGLNDSYIEQLSRFLFDLFIKFDFGTSYTKHVDVLDELLNRAPRTITLGWTCIILNTLIGVPLGIMCALHRNSIWDRGFMVLAMAGISMPGFWFALMMVILFTKELGWLPQYGIGTWKHWVMPIISGSLAGIANNARQTRSAVLETIRADFVTTARAKGVKGHDVTYKHMLPNALIPIVGGIGMRFGGAIAGTVVIETVFSFPGIGTYMMSGITSRDYPVVRSCILVLALFAAFATLLTDLAYGFIDPRIKAQYVNYGAKKRREDQ